jgi:hypothetical protein
MIPLNALEEMFENMRAHTKWNVDGPMLWGYFFLDPNADKLQKAADHLTDEGYRFVEIQPTDDGDLFVLHVERTETHSPQTLLKRNRYLHGIAERFDLDVYDGMDVGPAAS